MSQMRCPRCKGEGIIPAYLHVKQGRCFRCNGTGVITVDGSTPVFAVVENGAVVHVSFFDEAVLLARRLVTEIGSHVTLRKATPQEIESHRRADRWARVDAPSSPWHQRDPDEMEATMEDAFLRPLTG